MQPRKIALVAVLLSTVIVVPLAAQAKVIEPITGALSEVPVTAPKPVSQTQEVARVVTGFKFSGNTAFEADDLRPVLVSKIGAALDVKNIAADVKALRKMYSDKGMAVQVTDATQDEKGVMVFTLVEARILQIKLSGLVKVDESKVRALITSQANDLFQAAKINADLKRCVDTALFEEVTHKVEEDPDVKGGIIFTFVFKEKDAPAKG